MFEPTERRRELGLQQLIISIEGQLIEFADEFLRTDDKSGVSGTVLRLCVSCKALPPCWRAIHVFIGWLTPLGFVALDELATLRWMQTAKILRMVGLKSCRTAKCKL